MSDIQAVKYIWKNGELVNWEDATTHVLTHSLHYGDAIFEGLRAYKTADGKTAIFRLKEHFERFKKSAHMLEIDLPYTVEELCEATKELIDKNGLKSAYIRPILYRGYGVMGIDARTCKSDVVIAAWSWDAYLGDGALEKGIDTMVSSFRQRAVNAMPPAIKSSGNYLNSGLAKMEAVRNGYGEAIMLNEDGKVTEGTGENIFIVRDGALITPPTSDGLLEGITRDSIITIAREMGIEVRIESLLRTDLYIADEAFFSGSAAELTPIASVDGRALPKEKPLTKRLQKEFFMLVQGELESHKDWLSYLN